MESKISLSKNIKQFFLASMLFAVGMSFHVNMVMIQSSSNVASNLNTEVETQKVIESKKLAFNETQTHLSF